MGLDVIVGLVVNAASAVAPLSECFVPRPWILELTENKYRSVFYSGLAWVLVSKTFQTWFYDYD